MGVSWTGGISDNEWLFILKDWVLFGPGAELEDAVIGISVGSSLSVWPNMWLVPHLLLSFLKPKESNFLRLLPGGWAETL
jgi:hypothetical protein